MFSVSSGNRMVQQEGGIGVAGRPWPKTTNSDLALPSFMTVGQSLPFSGLLFPTFFGNQMGQMLF